MTILSRMFSGSRAPSFGGPRRGRDASRGQVRLSDVLEQLEHRRVLTATYLGVNQTNFANTTEETFEYVIDVRKSGPSDSGELWMRYNAQYNRVDFDTNSGFTNFGKYPPIGPVGTIGGPRSAPFSVPAIVTVVKATWNGPTLEENFHSAGIRINGGPGTTIHLVNGDPLPLGLDISLTTSTPGPGVKTSSIQLDGPIDTTLNPNAYGLAMQANEIITSAPIRDNHAGALFSARDRVEFRNTVTTGQVTSYLSDGTFHLLAGASINANLGVFMGQIGSGVGFGGVGGDILIDGTVNAGSVTLQTNSSSQATNIVTGPSGMLSGGGSLTLFNAGIDGGRIDVATKNFAVTNVNVGAPNSVNPDIGISIDQQAGNLRIAAVPSSSGQISLKASGAGAEIIVNSDIKTQGGLSLDATSLSITSPLTTQTGNIQLSGDTVTMGSNVTAGASGVGNVAIKSRKGAVSVLSAAVVSAPGGSIDISSATDVISQATLASDSIAVSAGGSITLKSNANTIEATAGTGISINDSDDLVVRSATTASGPISISAGGILTVDAVTDNGQGSATLSGSVGVELGALRLENGSGTVVSDRGSVRVTGTVAVQGTDNDLTLSSTTGNVIIESTASVSVADQLAISAPNGRVLTPGTVTAVRVDTSGAGYTSAPTVTLDAGSGATAAATVFPDGVSGIRVINGGTGYVTAPTVNIIGGGVNARATAYISGGSVTRIVVSNPGSGYSSATPPVITFSGGSGSGATAEAMVGGISAITVTAAGEGYIVPPDVVISAGAGAQVAAVSVDATGSITNINLSSAGGDYGVAPTVRISDSSGSGYGASATAALTSGVTNYLLTASGSGYATAPTVTFINAAGDTSGSGATAKALISGSVASISFDKATQGGSGYPANTTVQLVGDGQGARATATINGSVTSPLSVAEGGNGYAAVPIVSFALPDLPGGRQATATAALGLTDASVKLTYGAPQFAGQQPTLYTRAPSITFSTPAGGRAAQGTVLLDDTGLVTGVRIDDAGSGYTTFTDADVTVTGGAVKFVGIPLAAPQGNATNFTISELQLSDPGIGYSSNPGVSFSFGNASAVAAVTGSIDSVTLTASGSGYTTAPSVVFSGGTGASAGTTLSAQVIGLQILTAGTGYTAAPTASFSGGGGTGAVAAVSLSQVVSGINVGAGGTGYNPATTTVTLVPVAGGGGAVSAAVTADDSGRILSVNLATGGDDYLTAPTVTVNDTSGAGHGAVVTATVVNNKVTGFTVVDPGIGYNPATTVVTVSSKGSGATAVANLDANGTVASVTVTNSGSGYSAANAVNVRLVPYGRTATGTASFAPNTVTGVTVNDGGSGYTSAPTVTLSGNGTGATASATIVGGRVTGIAVSNPGSGYTGPVTVTISGGGGSGAAATALVGGVSGSIVQLPDNAGYANYAALPRVTFSGGGAATQATGTAIISNAAAINASRLSWTALEAPLEAVTSQFRKLNVNLTGKGDLVLNSTSGSLELQGATTVDGSILVSAPILSVTGNVVVGDASSTRTRQIALTASGGDLTIDSPVGTLLAGTQVRTPLAQKITLSALQGGIKSTAVPGLLTTNDVVFTATNSATLRTSTNTVSGSVSNSKAAISVTQTTAETNGTILPLDATLLVTAGGDVTVTAGDKLLVGRIDTGIAGTGIVNLTAAEIIENTVDAASDIVAGTVQLLAQTGNIQLDTTASLISGTASQGQITIKNVSSDGVLPVPSVKLQNLSARNDIAVTSGSTITAIGLNSVNGNTITLDASGATSDLIVEGVTSSKGIVSLAAGRDIKQNNPASATVSITTGTARVSAAGVVDLRTDVDSLAASADGNIDLIEAGDIVLGEPTGLPLNQFVKSTAGNVSVTAGGSISGFNVQALSNGSTPRTGVITLTTTGATGSVGLGSIAAGTVNVTTQGDVSDKNLGSGIIDVDTLTISASGGLVDLGNQDNRVGTFSAANAGGDVRVKDTAGGLIVAGITGKAIRLASNGAVTQTMTLAGRIVGTSLDVTTTGGSIDLQNTGNDVAQLSATTVDGAVSYADASGFDIVGISGDVITLAAAGDLTQSAVLTANSLVVKNTAGAVILGNTLNDFATVAITNTGRNITYADVSGFDIAGMSGGVVSLTAAGDLTQSAAITATSLAVTNTAGSVILGNMLNDATTVAITNTGRDVTYTDASGFDIAGVSGGVVRLNAAGDITQSAAITATSLVITDTAGAIILGNTLNDAATIDITNTGRTVTYTDANSFDIVRLSGGAVTLTGVGTLTQTGSIVASSLSVTTSGGAIDYQNDLNDVGAFSATAIDGNVSFRDANDVLIAGINAGTNAVLLQVAGGMTQSAAITAGSLQVNGGIGAIELADRGNAVASVTSMSTTDGDVTFVNSQAFATGPVSAGDTVDPGVPNDGNIFLKAITGDIAVNGDLTALRDRVTLDAGAGTITFGPGVAILADVLVYYSSPTAPAPELPAIRPSIVAANGNLDIVDPLPDNSVLQTGYETTGDITIRSAVGFDIAGILRTTGAGSTVTLTADNGSIRFLSGGGAVSSGLNGTLSIEAGLGEVTGATDTLLSAGQITVVVGESFATAGRVAADGLAVQGGGQSVSLTGTNTLDAISVVNGGTVSIDNTRGLSLGDIDGSTVIVNAAGAVTQTGSITAGDLQIDAGGNAILLDGSTNSVDSFGSDNGAGSVTLTNTSGSLVLTGITGGTVSITTSGAVSQTAPITASMLSIQGSGDLVTLTDSNSVGSLAVTNANGDVSFVSMTGALELAGISGGVVTINAAGAVSQTAAIIAQSLSVNASGNAITLTQANEVAAFAADNSNGDVSFTASAGDLALGTIQGGTVTLSAVGAISQTGNIVADVLSVTGGGSTITLAGQNEIGTFAADNASGDVVFTDSTGGLFLGNITSGALVVNAAGDVVMNGTTVVAQGNVTITTQSGGITIIGPQPNGLLQSSTQVDLAGVQGAIALVNGGQIVAPTILGNGRNIAVGSTITTTPDLNQAFDAINTLPIIAGSTYEVVIGANLTLSQTLVANRPMAMRSSIGVFTLSAGVGVSNGLIISSTARGSSITSLAFSGFGGTGIFVNNARNVALSGVTVTGTRTGTGTGLQISGASNGTTVRGSTFTNNPFGVKLTAAKGVTFGGTAAGQRNVISGAARAGVFASGVCTGSSVVKTAFSATRVRYSVRGSRGLRIVP